MQFLKPIVAQDGQGIRGIPSIGNPWIQWLFATKTASPSKTHQPIFANRSGSNNLAHHGLSRGLSRGIS
jgi:hypothetical protein